MRKNQPHKPRFRPLTVLLAGIGLLVTCVAGIGPVRAATGVPAWMPNISGYKELPIERFKTSYGEYDRIQVYFYEKDPHSISVLHQPCIIAIDTRETGCGWNLTSFVADHKDPPMKLSESEDLPGFPRDTPKPLSLFRPDQHVDFSQGSLHYSWVSQEPNHAPPGDHEASGPINLDEKTFTAYKDIACFEGPDYRFAGCMIGDHGFLITHDKIQTY